MTSLEKLLIKGIRSFSPDNQHVVEFFRPLTLIVGHNGAGKTTVIECLKYASTGDLPPNSRNGKSFVHDPKIAGETEVKGQIKLRFRTVSGKSVVCVRSFQLTQRASKLEFKQLESALRTTNEQGEKISLSYRCADLDKQVTELMGVSKAVLENVIFVHQEDSNWPLMEGATLKRKFDDIFAATRYTKALEEIRKARSERQNGIRDLKAEVKLLETYMDAFAQLKDRFSNDGARLEDVQSKIASANEEIQRVEDQLREAHAESEQLSELEDSVLALEAQYKSERQHRDRMEQELEEEFEEDDKELREFLETMDDKLDKVRGDIETLKQKLVNERESAAAANEHHRDLFQKKGEIEAEERVHARDVAELERLAQEAAQSWGIAEQNPVDVLAQMWQKKSLLNDELVRQRESHRQADDQLRVRAEEARSKAARALDQVAALERERDACTSRLEEIDAKRSAAERQFESLDELALQYKEAETRKEEAERQLAALNFAERESARRAELRAARERSALASERQRSLHLHADIRARLAEKKQRYDTKAPALAKGLRDMWSQAVVVLEGIDGEPAAHVVAKDPESASAAARTLEEALARAHERTVSLERELTAAAKEYSMVDGQLQACSSARQKRVDERARAEKRLADAGQDADTHAEVLATAENALENAREEFTSADVMAKTYHFQLQRAKKKHSCPMCERGFSDGEMEDFETLITERVQQLSTSNILDNARAELDRAKAEVEKLYALQEPCQTVHRAAEAIAAADEEIATLQAQRARTLDRRNELGSAHERSREQEEAMSKLVVRFTELRSQESELAGLQKEIAREEQRIRELCVSGASPEEIERELVDANAAVTAAEQAIERARDEHDSARAKVDYANETWRDLRERHLRAENAKLSIQQLQDERGKIVARTDDIAVEQRTAQHEAERMTAAAAAVDEERTVAQRKEDVRANEAEGKLRQLSSSAEALERLRSTVSAYDAAAVAQRAAAVRRDLAAAAELVSTAEASMENIRDIITQNERTLDTQETIRRNIEANIQYREQCKRAETIRERMAEQREQQRKFRPREELNAFIADLDRECNAARANRARLEGMYKEVSEKLEEIKRDMSSAQYEGIEDRLRSAQVQVRTTQLATQDLDLYHQALDKALMKYHALKMNEINKIIKELWQSTYRGSDIDTIAIRADDSGQGVRSYNYRVVMAKGDAELEMRGRCSAGQKVLASLIIRLALAETFCLNCGILALDEPTTNLDKDNMESFAQALGAIIASRRRQSNFQLIVITHDEEFVRLLGNREHADYYWRVFKDTNGHSRLERHSISMMS